MSSSDTRAKPKIETALAEVLLSTRKERGLSQESVAELADVDRSTVSDLERAIGNPGLYFFVRLAHALGDNPTELLGRVLARYKAKGGKIVDLSGRTKKRPRVRLRAARDKRST